MFLVPVGPPPPTLPDPAAEMTKLHTASMHAPGGCMGRIKRWCRTRRPDVGAISPARCSRSLVQA